MQRLKLETKYLDYFINPYSIQYGKSHIQEGLNLQIDTSMVRNYYTNKDFE